ncbi:MAG: Holliday junction resolvase RuvX [Candidatus Vogelbacteria bacterium CG10_big_fil_rev_8_21_14_0_10_49_38]|uniref:Putative pre-16S rRNA nuclease n=1 Tax=Candidatus Vogelbacteria bacterium CG10_big_fil_rev_8_21_14_0_10_49_38 TaxID=1975043 RepID=A0A2H0RI61_9BACT|nr:MAG: hypothetical protein BK006_00865 [bacterium CG10_49_38]PIR46229.1 MAG: Holliday junction resolvase RuvX [Candidatus Vogelbacteria bacterium CG10_big_fil_rev_8_21_14_0_10_49_38]
MIYLGIDYGHRKVGLAKSDESGRFAFPYLVLPNNAVLLETIKGICVKEGVGKVILGQSLDLSGAENPIQAAIAKFKDKLAATIGLPVEGQTEFFTTREARRVIDEGQTDPATDARAAALILKSYLDKHSG